MHRLLPILITIFMILLLPAGLENYRAEAQSDSVIDVDSRSIFSEKIIFHARVDSTLEIKEVLVSFTPQGQVTRLEKMSLVRNNEALYEVSVNRLDVEIDASPLMLAPFTRITYRFEAYLSDGTKLVSPEYSLRYEDTRFTWNSQTDGIFEVYWNDEDLTLGQEIINVAKTGMEKAQSILQADPPDPLRIYAYRSSTDLQEALMTAGDTWVAGHASPDLGMILISIPSGPEKKLELQRQIPHEIMHLLQYQVTGSNFYRQPIWLLEGMASIAEAYPNPEYRRVLEDTSLSDNFLPMESLCSSFPDDAGPAFRAYAQSESFVRFLFSIYGNKGLRDLMDQYQNGLSCTEAVAATFGTSLGQLEYRWKQEVLGLNAGGLAVRQLSPYLWVGLVLIISTGLSIFPFRRSKRILSNSSPQKTEGSQ